MGISACSGTGGLFDPEEYDFHDRKQELSRSAYRDMMRPTKDEKNKDFRPYIEPGKPEALLGAPPIPEVTEILAAPRPPAIGETQLVSIFVTDDVPLKDVLIELGRLADVDMEIDSSIRGGIVFRAQNRPFNEVIERIASLADLRYEMKNGVLRIERDTPVVRTYPLNFLSFDRASQSGINISTSVLSTQVGGGGGGGGGGGNQSLASGSTAAVNYTAESDFWTQLGEGLRSIVAYAPASRSQSPDFGGSDEDRPATITAAGGGGSAAGGSAVGGGQVTVNRQGGTVTVNASHRVHRMVEDYLRKLEDVASSQVLIEAKIIEVTLDDRYQSGVNWNQVFSSHFASLDVDFNNIDASDGNLTRLIIGGRGVDDPSLDAIVDLTETFGTSRTLSSPRIHAMNNQQAVLTFAQNLVYFDVSVDREQQIAGDTVLPPILTVDSQVMTVPIGIIISLHPSINTRTNEVTLSIRPTLSRVVDFIPDPAVAFLLADLPDLAISNQIPQIEVRELDSLMRMRSGQIMVLGGLMEQVGENNDAGVPFLSGIPWVGNAFKTTNKHEQVRELFFLVKATIIGNTSTVHEADKHIYRKFTTDHRPLAF